MQIKRTITENITAGDIEVDLTCDGKGVPTSLRVRNGLGLGDDGLSPEAIERLAELLQDRRREAGDSRSVCGTHGYYKPAERTYRCPTCDAEKAKTEARPPALAA